MNPFDYSLDPDGVGKSASFKILMTKPDFFLSVFESNFEREVEFELKLK